MGHLLTQNHSGLVIGAQLTAATGRAERDTAMALIADIPWRHQCCLENWARGGDLHS